MKLFAAHLSGVSMDSLHVVVGVLAQLTVATLLGSGLGAWRPWLAVLALELANEANDLLVEQWPNPGMQWGEGTKDLVLTMLLPTVLMVVARHRPRLLAGPPPLIAAPDPRR